MAPLNVFQEGELALMIHHRQVKHRLVKLDSTKYTETSTGRLAHTDIIGKEVGSQPRTALGTKVTVQRPSLEEYTLLMHRGATPSYCSTMYAAICMLDIGSGSRVVEAGTGSGAMTLHLSRIGAYFHTLLPEFIRTLCLAKSLMHAFEESGHYFQVCI